MVTLAIAHVTIEISQRTATSHNLFLGGFILHDLTKGKPIIQIIYFTIPLLIGNIFQQVYTLSDTIIVGRTIGVQALAAVGATGSLSFLIIGIAQGATNGFAIIAARRYGAGDYRGIKRSFATGILISLALSLILSAISMTFCGEILRLMQTPSDIIQDAYTFLIIQFGGIFAIVAYNLFANMIRAMGDSRTPLVFLIIACVINIGLELLFIVVFKWGIAGASFATLLAQFISACLCLVFIYRHFPLLQVSKADFKISKAEISEHLKMGLPMGFQSSIIALGQVILQLMLNTLGSTSVAAYTAAARIDGLATMPAMSFGITMATFAAQNLGAREFARIRSGVKQTLAVSLTFSTVTGILIIIFGHSLVNLFVGNGQPLVTNTAQTYFYFNSSLYWLLSILFVVRYTLQGLGQSLVPTLAGIMELIMRAFAGLVLINAFGFAGASMANPLAWLGSLLVLISSYVRTMRHLRTLETAPNEQFVK